MARDALLYVVARESRFTAIDRDALARRWPVRDWTARHPVRAAPATARAAAGARAVVVWFAGWHAVVPVTVAWLLRRPSLVITGGYDVTSVPEAGYGMRRNLAGRLASRWVLSRATLLMANSESGRAETLSVVPRAAARTLVVHHGIPDFPGEPGDGPRGGALTVGVVDSPNLLRKGLLAFAAAAARLPEVPFVVAGPIADPAAARRLREAGDVELTGELSDAQLAERYRGAGTYVQASRHEGFGMSVAEAMLGGCVPVVTRAGALPEVVGDAGIVIDGDGPEALAAAIRTALAASPEARRRARARVLEHFTLERREAGLAAAVERALGSP